MGGRGPTTALSAFHKGEAQSRSQTLIITDIIKVRIKPDILNYFSDCVIDYGLIVILA